MTLSQFDSFLKHMTHAETMIVRLRYKYSYDTEWTTVNEILEYENGDYIWNNDWNEGQEDIEILGYEYLSKLDIRSNLITTIKEED